MQMRSSWAICLAMLIPLILATLPLPLSTPAGASLPALTAQTVRGTCCAVLSESAFGANVVNLGPPAPEAVTLVRSISDTVGIRASFEILAGDFSKSSRAFATIRNGQRYIVYDRKEFSWGTGEASWEDLWIMGHEIGHHVASHTFTDEYSSHEQELEADRFGGFAMFKLGAPLSAALAVYTEDHPASPTHPGSSQRRAAIKAGWLHGNAMNTLARQNSCRVGWSGKELDIDGSICRMAHTCDGDGEAKLACKDYDGAWRWIGQ